MRTIVSVVIPNYNYAAYLGSAIESALAQTWPDVEVIVVDDGSTDDSRAVIARYPGVRAVFQANAGQCAAVREGLRLATGDIVITLDSDDQLMPDACERVVALWRPACVALFYRLEIVGMVERSGETLPRYPFVRANTTDFVTKTGSLVYAPASGNAFDLAFARRVFDLSQGLTDASHDLWLCLSAALLGRAIWTDEVLGRYRIHADNHSQPGRPRKMSAIRRDLWYRWNAQQSAWKVARSYGMALVPPRHLVGAYYLQWSFLLRGASGDWAIPEVPFWSGLATGLWNFWNLTTIGFGRRLRSMLVLVVVAVSPRSLRRLIAARWYGYVDDIGF